MSHLLKNWNALVHKMEEIEKNVNLVNYSPFRRFIRPEATLTAFFLGFYEF